MTAPASAKDRALIFQGGWPGHVPAEFAVLLAGCLRAHGIAADIRDTLDGLEDAERLRRDYSLIVPCWTMGALSATQSAGLREAVRGGVGLGGIHGGMGDAFRGDIDYEWMVGGHFVGHPHVGEYEVQVADAAHPITQGLPAAFPYRSEQYYMLMDPSVHVLADTPYHHDGATVTVPVAWTKQWGAGRVFYSSLGHATTEFSEHPAALELTTRGLLWAAGRL